MPIPRYFPATCLAIATIAATACSREPSACSDSDTVALLRVLIEGVEPSPDNKNSAAYFSAVSDFTEKDEASGDISCTAKFSLSKQALTLLSSLGSAHAGDLSSFRGPIVAEYKLRHQGDGERTVVLTNFDLARAQKLQRLHSAFLNPPSKAQTAEATPALSEEAPSGAVGAEDPSPALEAAGNVPAPSEGTGNRGHVSTPRTLAATEFYRHLGLSDVETAGEYVVPEKRGKGPVSSAAADFYNGLQEPLRLEDVQPGDSDTAIVRYSYRNKEGSKCNVSSLLTFSKRGDDTLIESIRARSSCN